MVRFTENLALGPEAEGKSLLAEVRRAFPELTPRAVFKLCRMGEILQNGRKTDPAARLKAGDLLLVTVERAAPVSGIEVLCANVNVATPAGPFIIIREDADLLAVEKPPGCASHPALRRSGDTLIDRVKHYLGASSESGFSPALANRLDIETSGIVLVGKNRSSRARLGRDIQARVVEKRYLALVAGRPPETGEITLPLEKKADSRALAKYPEGHGMLETRIKEAHTRFRVLGRSSNILSASLVEVELLTGRNHQIRRHFAAVGHPVALDRTYGDAGFNRDLAELLGLDRMFLHAHRAALPHPSARNIIKLFSPLPAELAGCLAGLGIDPGPASEGPYGNP